MYPTIAESTGPPSSVAGPKFVVTRSAVGFSISQLAASTTVVSGTTQNPSNLS